jgi:hypothetical protein
MRRFLSLFLVSIIVFTTLPSMDIGEAAPLTRKEARELARKKSAERYARRRGQVSSESSSTSRSSTPVSSSRASSVSSAGGSEKLFLSFLGRFVSFPQEWEVTIGKDKATFVRTTDGNQSGTFTVELIPHTECDVNAVQKDYRKRHDLSEEEPSIQVDFMRIPGIFGAGYTWLDGSTPGGNRHWCVIPRERIGVSHIRADDGEGDTKAFVEKTMLRQLGDEPRGRR